MRALLILRKEATPEAEAGLETPRVVEATPTYALYDVRPRLEE